MNIERRKRIEEARALLEQAKEIISGCQEQEREYFDNMPEAFQQGERGQRAEEAADALDSATTSIDEALDAAERAAQ